MLLSGCQQALSTDENYILSRSYYEDKTNALTLGRVQEEPFTPFQDILSGGYKASTFWVKIRLKPSDQPLVMKIRPVYNEEIQIYDPASPELKNLVGSNFPHSANQFDGISFNYLLPPHTTDRDIYLRIKSSRTYVVYVEAMSLISYQRIDRREQLFAAAYTTFTLILAVGLLLTWLINRELVLGLFAIQQILAFLHAFFHVGFAAILLDSYINPRSLNYAWCLVVIAYPLVAFIANKLLLDEYGLKHSYKKTANFFITMSVFVIFLFLMGRQDALMLNANLVLLAMAFFAITAWLGLDSRLASFKSFALPLGALRFYYSFNLIIWIATVIPMLGLVSFGEIPLYTLFVYNILSGLVFFLLLQYRARVLHKFETKRSSLLEFEAKQEREQREEQSMLMAMLSHEIKTPLSVLKLIMDEKVAGSDLEGHANRAVNNINFIVNRCLQLGKLDARAIQVNLTHFNVEAFFEGLLDDCQNASRVRVKVLGSLFIHADHEILRVVFSNLIENALKYGDQKQSVEVLVEDSFEAGSHGVLFGVSNHIGLLGVPDPSQVFKKYYRNPQATKVSGSGLGLFLVHELVGVMGGKVKFHSENDKVLFSVWIPA